MAHNRKVTILENITHYLTAFIIILKGFDKIENPEKVAYAIVFLVIGTCIILGTIFHHKAKRLFKHFKAYVFALEAVVMSLVGYLFMSEGKQFIQYVCFASVVGFVIALVVYIRKSKRMAETHFS